MKCYCGEQYIAYPGHQFQDHQNFHSETECRHWMTTTHEAIKEAIERSTVDLQERIRFLEEENAKLKAAWEAQVAWETSICELCKGKGSYATAGCSAPVVHNCRCIQGRCALAHKKANEARRAAGIAEVP